MQLFNYPAPHTFTRDKSAALFEEAKKYFPGGVHSPVRAFKSVIGPPIFFEKGLGCHLRDADGQDFIDYCGSWGPLILGHVHPAVLAAVQEAAGAGMSFGAPSPRDLRIGRLVLENHPYIDMIRFVSSGTEAVMSAVRLARGATGKSKILKFEGCYHGHVDSLMVKAGSGLVTFGISTSAGIPESFAAETLVAPLDDQDAFDAALARHGDDLAAVIIEPIPANNGLLLQRKEFLEYVRAQTLKKGILLIFDEVISGFRVGFSGAAGFYDIQPDIITFGKIIGGGMPVGAYAASQNLMRQVAPEGPVYQAGTLSANPVAMAAGTAALTELLKPGFYESLGQKTDWFVAQLQAHADEKGYEFSIPHIGSIFWLNFSRKEIRRADQIDPGRMELFKVFHLECLKRGLYFGPSGYEVGFISAAHTMADLEYTLEKMFESLAIAFQ